MFRNRKALRKPKARKAALTTENGFSDLFWLLARAQIRFFTAPAPIVNMSQLSDGRWQCRRKKENAAVERAYQDLTEYEACWFCFYRKEH